MTVDTAQWDAEFAHHARKGWLGHPGPPRQTRAVPSHHLTVARPDALLPHRKQEAAAPATPQPLSPAAARSPAPAGAPAETAADHTLAVVLEAAGTREFRAGVRIVALAVGIGGGFAAFVPLSGGVVASGSVVAATDAKTIQAAAPGVIREILVQDGAKVAAGQTLVRLDANTARQALTAVARRLLEVRALTARLEAERDGADYTPRPMPALDGVSESDTALTAAAQRSLFDARASAREQQTGVLQSHITQLQSALAATQAQLKAKQEQREMSRTELAAMEALFRDQLTTLNRVMTLRRDFAQLEGDVAQLTASIAETRSKIGEAEMEAAKAREDFKLQVLADLRDAAAKLSDTQGQYASALEQWQHTDIAAPQSGIVHDLSVHTVGGFVGAGQALMLIAPDEDALQVEAQVPPAEIDQVAAGQPARLRFAAFDRNITPEIAGSIAYVSPDTTRDPRTGASYYPVRVSIDDREQRRLGDLHLLSGMPAEVILTTRGRTLISYLMKPFTDQLTRAFRGR